MAKICRRSLPFGNKKRRSRLRRLSVSLLALGLGRFGWKAAAHF